MKKIMDGNEACSYVSYLFSEAAGIYPITPASTMAEKVDELSNKGFYAFDYNKHTWYYLGTFNNDSVWIILGHEDDSDIETQKSKLSIGGVWFIVENK